MYNKVYNTLYNTLYIALARGFMYCFVLPLKIDLLLGQLSQVNLDPLRLSIDYSGAPL